MSRGDEAVEMMYSLSDLPDDPLSEIICRLDMKDAVKTSILSKRWRYIWANYVVDLNFNHVNVLGMRSVPHKKKCVGVDTVFVRMVDKIMKQRFEGNRNRVNSFRLQFPLGASFSSSIDGWINHVVANYVETIDLDLYSHLPLARYNFSLLRTVSNYEKRMLKHLRITHCNFQGRTSSKKFGSLITLHLLSVNISNVQMANVLESCTLLEELTLDECCNLTKLTIGDPCSLLKHLSLINCLKLGEIDLIRAQNLIYLQLTNVSINSHQLRRFIDHCPLLEELTLINCPQLTYLIIFESNNSPLKYLHMENCWELTELEICAKLLHTLEYYPMSKWFSVIKTPRLVNVFIGENADIEHPLTVIPRDIPWIKSIILSSYHPLNYFFFANDRVHSYFLRRLALHVTMRDNDKDELLCVSYILKAFPLLETLELNFRNFKWDDNEEIKTFEKCHNVAITKLEMNGFNGWQGEVNVLMYLLETLTALKELAIGPCFKRYESFNCWSNDVPTERGEKWFHCNSEWPRAIVPQPVNLKIMKDLDSDLI